MEVVAAPRAPGNGTRPGSGKTMEANGAEKAAKEDPPPALTVESKKDKKMNVDSDSSSSDDDEEAATQADAGEEAVFQGTH